MSLDFALNINSSLIIFTSLLLSIFLSVVPTERKLPNYLLAIIFVLTAIDISGWLLQYTDLRESWLNAFRYSLGFIQMPILSWFILSSCYSDFKFKKQDLLHFTPFLFVLTLTLADNQLNFATATDTSSSAYFTRQEGLLCFYLSHLQYYLYIAFIIKVLLDVKAVFHENFSDARSMLLTWLLQYIAISVFAHTISLARGLVFIKANQAYTSLQLLSSLLVLAIFIWIALKALLRPELFRGIDQSLKRLALQPKTKSIEGSETIHNKETENDPQINDIKNHMLNEQPFLDAELSLRSLADQLEMMPRDLSEIVNQKLNLHFFNFVNSYRIDHAKKMLVEKPSVTILEILYQSGFNSKSSFNTAFKKHTNLTPTAFRKAHAT